MLNRKIKISESDRILKNRKMIDAILDKIQEHDKESKYQPELEEIIKRHSWNEEAMRKDPKKLAHFRRDLEKFIKDRLKIYPHAYFQNLGLMAGSVAGLFFTIGYSQAMVAFAMEYSIYQFFFFAMLTIGGFFIGALIDEYLISKEKEIKNV